MLNGHALEAAHNGAVLLDAEMVAWWRRVDRTLLRIGNPGRYILMELYGSHAKGAAKLALDTDEMIVFGFCADVERYNSSNSALAAAWDMEVKARLELDRIVVNAFAEDRIVNFIETARPRKVLRVS